MLVRCPKCETGFRLPANRIPAKGAKLRCSACTHAFRVRMSPAGDLEVFDPNEANDRTQLGAPAESSAYDDADDEAGASTQFGPPARSKSAAADYNPFPLAGRKSEQEAEAAGNTTQALGSAPSEAFEVPDDFDDFDDFDDEEEISLELADDDIELVGEDREVEDAKTQLGAAALALDLFDGEPMQAADASEDLSSDFDPFGDAFSDPISSADMGLLMPSTPSSDDLDVEIPSSATGSHAGLDTTPSSPMSDEAFFSGGYESEFGSASELVDPNFGSDVAQFDPDQGVVRTPAKQASKRPSSSVSGSHRQPSAPELGLDVVDTPKPQPAARIETPRNGASRSVEPVRAPSGRIQARRPVAAPSGEVSPIRRAFDVVFIGLVVLVAGLGFTAARAGSFLDFARFDHTLEVAYSGVDFEPRPEWVRTIEVEPPTPPPEEPLRLENVRAWEVDLGDETAVVVSGKIRNYSNKSFRNIELHAELVDGEGKAVQAKDARAGGKIDRSKARSTKSHDALQKLVTGKVADVGKEGTIHFTIVFDPLADKALDGLDYRVAISDSES